MDEVRAFFELLAMLVTDPRTGVLLALLAAAAVSDYRSYRIPNLLTFGGMAFALVYNLLVPAWHAQWTWGPAGMLLGLVAMLPMYAIGVMGAGDVKLMAMAGAFLGMEGTLYAVLFSVVAGGLGAIAVSLLHGALGRLLANTGTVVRGMVWSAVARGNPGVSPGAAPSVGKLPYGVAIAVGTASYIVARQFGLV
ncbi:prepilin peptidase [Massilia agilis]|uniref:Prepilin peptidase n=1 Tax=Massilia agilis TaxID=1811226 RepID=A0ABT2D6Q9_9BURK|nr:prepilin peptidase [Massilia agilis]MCS0806995.1 prepilin peptidase [Massilia agilis]